MGLARAALSEADRRFIIGRSGGCCNKCTKQIFRENEFSERARIGDDAHIWAYSEDGPRGSDPSAPADRNSRENIILLCKNCHSEVDQQPIEFTTMALTAMRESHYEWVEACLGQDIIQKPRFHYLLYINAPRVDMYAAVNSIALPRFDFGLAKCFRDLRYGAGRAMASYTHIFNSEQLYAYRIRQDDDLSRLEVGKYCFVVPISFRTVAIGKETDIPAAWESDRSIIYRRFGEWTLVCLIDPQWITTSTAESTLRSGQAQLCGLVRINRTDPEARKIYASPLFLAQSGGILDANQL